MMGWQEGPWAVEAATAGANVEGAKLALPTAYGTLVASVRSQDGGTDGFEVGLVSGDSYRVVADVSATEPLSEGEYHTPGLYVSAWAGSDDDVAAYCEGVPTAPRGVGSYHRGSGPWYGCDRTQEDKGGFAQTVSLALAANDPERYGGLATDPLYVISSADHTEEYLVCGDAAVNVTGDSLTAVGRAAMDLAAGEARDIMPLSTAAAFVRHADERARGRAGGGR